MGSASALFGKFYNFLRNNSEVVKFSDYIIKQGEYKDGYAYIAVHKLRLVNKFQTEV